MNRKLANFTSNLRNRLWKDTVKFSELRKKIAKTLMLRKTGTLSEKFMGWNKIYETNYVKFSKKKGKILTNS